MPKIAEIIEATTTDFTAQCYELNKIAPFGALVKTVDGEIELYGIVYNATTESVEPGRRPIARGRDEPSTESIFSSNPQLSRLLRSEFNAIVVGYRKGELVNYYLPPNPARIHGFVDPCTAEDVKSFSDSLDFLDILLNSRLALPVEEVTGAALRQMSEAHEDPRRFLVTAGKKLASLLGEDFTRLRIILNRIKR
jgi:hypothetical protein